MRTMHRRHFLSTAMLAPTGAALFVHGDVAWAQQVSDKPKVKLSEALPALSQDVERMSQDVKEQTGVELSTEQKNKMVNALLSQMNAEGTYDFVDP
jgi:uncharacterized protein YpuA (DUF1002 family)